MTLTELRYIVTLAQEQHFGRAAERCPNGGAELSAGARAVALLGYGDVGLGHGWFWDESGGLVCVSLL